MKINYIKKMLDVHVYFEHEMYLIGLLFSQVAYETLVFPMHGKINAFQLHTSYMIIM